MSNIDETKGTTNRTSQTGEVAGSRSTEQSAESERTDNSSLVSGTPGTSEGREAYRKYRELLFGGDPPSDWEGGARRTGGDGSMSAHELQAARSASESNSSGRIREASRALGEKRQLMLDREGFYDMEWQPRSTGEWYDAYMKEAGTDESAVHDNLQRALAGGGSHLSDERLSRAVSVHKEKLEAEGAFEGWSEREVENWERGVEKFAKAERSKSRLENFDAGRVEGLPELAYDPADRSYSDAEKKKIRAKLDQWEQEQTAKFEQITQGADELPAELEVDVIKERIRSARELYESVTVGAPGEEPKALPEEAPQHLEGEPKPVRAAYVQHLRENPGDLLGAYSVAEDRTEYRRADDAARNAQFGVPKMFQ